MIQCQFIASFSIVAEYQFIFRSRIAKNAMLLAERFDLSDEMVDVHLHFHRGAGQLDSYQLCATQLRKSFASGLSSGNANIAFFCAGQGVQFSVISAEKDLISLLQEIDYYRNLLEIYKSELTKYCLLCYRETVSTFIDKGKTTAIEAKLTFADVSDPGNKLLEMFYFHQVFKNYWIGYAERCDHYVQRYGELSQPRHFEAYIIKFYHGKLQQVYFGTLHTSGTHSHATFHQCRS